MMQRNRSKSLGARSGHVAWRIGLGALLLVSLGAAIDATPLQNVPQQPRPASTSLFAQHVAQAGLKRCATAYPALGAMVAKGATYNVASSWNTKAPDANPIQGLVGLTLAIPQYQGPAAGVVFAAPTAANGCAGNAVRVIPFPQSCPVIVKQLPAGSRLLRDMAGTAIYEIGGSQGQVMLISAKTNCVAVSINRIG